MPTQPPPPMQKVSAKENAPKVHQPPARVDSHILMGGQRVLEIVHQGEVYRLQTTRLSKLILTK